MAPCQHISLQFGALESDNSDYKQTKPDELQAALQVDSRPHKRLKTTSTSTDDTSKTSGSSSILALLSTFPAPIVVPRDQLSYGPQERRQTVQDWLDLRGRNEVTEGRTTIYVAPPPTVSNEVDFVNGWTTPDIQNSAKSSSNRDKVELNIPPHIDDVVEYLQAFYYGISVKRLDEPTMEFTAWEESRTSKRRKKRSQNEVSYIGLSSGNEKTRVRCRLSKDEIFQGQLNLNDLLDVAIQILPSDAYALLMLVNHDLYEDEDDDFCCGRAYGGSRVAVVSTARYRRELDKKEKIDVEHSWPTSHCKTYLGKFFSNKTPMLRAEKLCRETVSKLYPGSAVAESVLASNAVPLPSTPEQLSTMWLGRVCKTAAHELGHCFGIGHCSYYACIMQGTARIAEDIRQPPYLCPIDLSKVLRATNVGEKERYRALLAVCNKWKDDRMFAAFATWIETRLDEPSVIVL